MSITAGELAMLRGAAVASMNDTCQRLVFTATGRNAAGEITATYNAGATYACGLHLLSAKELERADMTPTRYDGTLRLPVTATIDARDRLSITKRYGEALATPWTYEIVGGPRVGPSAIQVDVKRVDL